jgi:hypothetical protein
MGWLKMDYVGDGFFLFLVVLIGSLPTAGAARLRMKKRESRGGFQLSE